jgi:hypothetical protein
LRERKFPGDELKLSKGWQSAFFVAGNWKVGGDKWMTAGGNIGLVGMDLVEILMIERLKEVSRVVEILTKIMKAFRMHSQAFGMSVV